jgi:signal transduction histidine kinase
MPVNLYRYVERVEQSRGGSVLVGLLAAGLGAGFVLHFLVYDPIGNDPLWKDAAEAVFAILPVAGMAYASLWLYRVDMRLDRIWRIALWTVSGLAAIVLMTLLTLGHQQITGGDTAQIAFYLSGNASIGATAGLLVGLYDVQAKRQADRVEAMRDTFAFANRLLRHDVLNAVNIIEGYAGQLGATESSDGVDIIRTQAREIVTLIQNARALERATTDEQDLEAVDLETTLDRHITAARSTYDAATFECSVPAVAVRADDVLGALFENILSNAVEHNDTDSPEITVAGHATDDRVQVRIADNGPGVPDERKEAVFGAESMSAGGLGLYLVQTLVDRYDGAVWVEDNDPRGAVFVVELERADVTPTESTVVATRHR